MNDQQPDKSGQTPPEDSRSFQEKLKTGLPVVRERAVQGSRKAWNRTKLGYKKADTWLLDQGDKVKAIAGPLTQNLRNDKWPRFQAGAVKLTKTAASKTKSGLRNIRVNSGTGFKKLRVNTGAGLKRIRVRTHEAGQTFRVKSSTAASDRKNNRAMKVAARAYKPYKYRGLYSRIKRHGRQKVYRLKGYTTVARVNRKRRRERLRHHRNQLLITAVIVIGLIMVFLWLDPIPKITAILEDIGFLD